MRHLLQAFALLVLLGALIVAGVVLLRDVPTPTEEVVSVIPRPERPPSAPGNAPRHVRGGVYAGVVVDPEGEPVVGATVLLVAWDAGDDLARRLPESTDETDVGSVMRIGYRTAGETRSDAAGRFRVAADAYSAIRLVVAWHPGHVPSLTPIEAPQEGIHVTLQRAGKFVGTVVDGETGRPIPSARIAIYLQQRAIPVAAGIGETATGTKVERPLSQFAVAQRWVAQELGPRVWGIDDRGDEALHVSTDAHGVFRFGPIGDDVQLEFVVTHPDYLWSEFDKTDRGTVERTVVRPGQTVERTFELEPGKSFDGRVLDPSGKGVEGVLVFAEHVSQYTQHWKYRTTARRTRTGRDGRFHVGGLSFGPWLVTLKHPSFGAERPRSVREEEAAQGPIPFHVLARGALNGLVDGLARVRFGMKVELHFRRLSEETAELRRERKVVPLRPDATFQVPNLRPGRYRAWVVVEGKSSQPQELEIGPLQITDMVFPLGGGGTVELSVFDVGGRIVDPATAQLLGSKAGPEASLALGRYVSRGGRVVADGVVPGRYRLRLEAPGFLSEETEHFDVLDGGRTVLETVVLHRPARLRVVEVRGPGGRPPKGAVHVTLQEGDAAPRPLYQLDGPEVPVRPGRVTVRATTAEGLSYEESFEATDDQRVDVRVQLQP